MEKERQPKQESKQKRKPNMIGEIMELTKEQILSVDDIAIEKVETPEWGGHVFIRIMNAKEYYDYGQSCLNDKQLTDNKYVMPAYCSFVICNKKGERIFSIEDIEKLSQKHHKSIMRIYKAAIKLNGDDIEELEKNSEETRNDAFISG